LAVVHTTSSSDEGDEAYNVDFINTGDDVNVVSTFSTSSLTLCASSGGGSSGGGGGGSVVIKPVTPVIAVPTIAEGERSGTVIINIPNEDGYGYILDVRVSDDSDKYFRDIYYKSNKSTVIKNNATVVDNKTSNISIELIKQHEITGNINAIGFVNSSNRITAICQEEESIMEDIYDSPFSVYTDIYGSGTYNIYVPDEFDKYILKLKSFQRGGSIYYNVPKSVEKIDDAKILTINGDTANVDFEYDGYNPPTVKENAPPVVVQKPNEDIQQETNVSDNQSQVVYRTRTGKKYHRAGCSYLKSKIETTVSDAQAMGLGPCSRCNPPR